LDFFDSLPLNTRLELFNKCPDAVIWPYSWDDLVYGAKKISQGLKEPFAKKFLLHLCKPLNKRHDEEDRLWTISVDGKPVSPDAFEVVSLLCEHTGQDLTQKRKVIEALVHHPDPDIRYGVIDYVQEPEHIKALAVDPYFYVRRRIIKRSIFAKTDFSVEELMEVIADDPRVAEMVIEKHHDRDLIHDLCTRLAESRVLEIRAMAIQRLFDWNLLEDFSEEDEEIEVDADEDEIDDDLLEDFDE